MSRAGRWKRADGGLMMGLMIGLGLGVLPVGANASEESATTLSASEATVAPTTATQDSRSSSATPRDRACGVAYSQHLSANSDLGSDVKNGRIACAVGNAEYEVGIQAITPPNGDASRHPVYVDGHLQVTSRQPSTLMDTADAYVGYSRSWDNGLAANVKLGMINGPVGNAVSDAITATHRWEGKHDSRRSPVTSGARPLVQLTVVDHPTLFEQPLGWGSATVKLTTPLAATAGTLTDAVLAGAMLHLQARSSTPGTPDLLAKAAPLKQDPDVFIGVLGQATAYDLPTHAVGTEPARLYAIVGVQGHLGRWDLGVNLEKDLSSQVRSQRHDAYAYLGASVSRRF